MVNQFQKISIIILKNNIKNKSVNLSIIIVGDRQDSLIYVNIKKNIG